MLHLFGPASKTANTLSRREMLRIGGLGMTGLSLPMLLESGTRGASPAAKQESAGPKPKSFGRAKNCIILYLSGGPPQHDMWDPKPHAPGEIRGELDTID